MKQKRITLIVLAMLFGVALIAQETASDTIAKVQTKAIAPEKKRNIWIGPKFGMDIARFTTSSNELGNSLASNYQFGLLCQIGKKYYIQPEVLYASYKSPDFKTDSLRANYLKIPVMLGWRLINLGILSIHLKGGPLFSFQIEKNRQYTTGAKFLSWQVGAGLDLLGFITTDIRYTLQSGKNISEQIDDFGKNINGLNLSVGLKLR